MQRLTLIGLSNYDNTLFDNLVLPDGYDKETFINSLLLEHGEKCVLYSNPAFMKNAIGLWGRKWSLELARIYEALTAEYDPIYNYDRYEEYTDEEKRELNTSSNAGHTASDSPNYNDDVTNDYDVVTESNRDSTTEDQVSADNASGYQPEHKTIVNGGKSTQSNDGTIKRHISGKTQDLTESSNQTGKDTESKDFKHTAHLYGNIGVTTNVDMWSQEIDARIKYNLYGAAARLFANELLIGIY
jgi:hypothetical protein